MQGREMYVCMCGTEHWVRRLYVNINVFCVIVDERALDYAGNKRRVLCMLYGDDDERARDAEGNAGWNEGCLLHTLN